MFPVKKKYFSERKLYCIVVFITLSAVQRLLSLRVANQSPQLDCEAAMHHSQTKEHRYGSHSEAYAKFLKRSIQLTSNSSLSSVECHSNGLHNYLTLTYKDAVLLGGKLSDSSQSYELEGERSHAEEMRSTQENLKAVCSFCGSHARKTIRVVPKPKTSKAVLKSIKRQAARKFKGSRFDDHLMDIYYNKPSRVQFQCGFCKEITFKIGEKRSGS